MMALSLRLGGIGQPAASISQTPMITSRSLDGSDQIVRLIASDRRLGRNVGEGLRRRPGHPAQRHGLAGAVDQGIGALNAHWCTFGLAGAKRRSGVACANPSICRDGLRCSPLDGPHETSRAAGAGRTGRTTG